MATNKDGLKWLFKLWYDWNEIPQMEGYAGYMKSLLICANGDGELAPEERDFVIGYASAFDAAPELLDELRNYPATEDIDAMISSHPDSNQSRRSLIYDAFRVCGSDGTVSDGEKATIRKMAKNLSVPDDDVAQIEEIVNQESELRSRRIGLFFAD